jgi:hypothetical protein
LDLVEGEGFPSVWYLELCWRVLYRWGSLPAIEDRSDGFSLIETLI